MKPTASHYALVAAQLLEGDVIPFLGAGANLCDRPDGTSWKQGVFTPSGSELAQTLAKQSFYPEPGRRGSDLQLVSQYVDAELGKEDLYGFLHEIFDADYPVTSLHRLLARVSAVLRERGKPQLVVVTTNYDDLIERALREGGEKEVDVVWYDANHAPEEGTFVHRAPDGTVTSIAVPNEYTGLAPDERPIVLKLHGAINRDHKDAEGDSYVLTETSYDDYLSGRDVGAQIPVSLLDRIEHSHFLFLGYSMRDWNLRVVLNRIWGAKRFDLRSWAVQREPESEGQRVIDEALWRERGKVSLLHEELKEYVRQLDAQLTAVTAAQ